MALVPNLNWAGDTSLPRYFQIRGIGELQQYQGAPNPSIGFLIDDIDFSGLGMAATLFDVDQIEVLHGPQSTIYGANALGGLIYIRSAEPADTFGGRVELDAGNYDERSFGAVVTGPVPSLDSSFRFSAQQYLSEGFYHNIYLDRDTDNRNELTLRGKWRYQPSDVLGHRSHGTARASRQWLRCVVDLQRHPHHVVESAGRRPPVLDRPVRARDLHRHRAANLDHNRDLRGHDRQLLVRRRLGQRRILVSLYLRLLGDSGTPPLDPQPRGASRRQRPTWVLMAVRRLRSATEGGAGRHEYRRVCRSVRCNSEFGQLDRSCARATARPTAPCTARSPATSAHARAGRWDCAASGARRITTTRPPIWARPTTYNNFDPENNLWGGHISLDYNIAKGQQIYALVSRGYKAGGFNLSPGLPTSQLQFSPEWDLNYELGHKAELADNTVRIDTSIFYMQRHSEQLLTGEQLCPTIPTPSFFTRATPGRATTMGSSPAFAWLATQRLELGGSLGLLQTQYRGFVQDGVEFPDRALPHAPPWTSGARCAWHDPRGPFARLDVTGMGGFFYDMPPNWTRSHRVWTRERQARLASARATRCTCGAQLAQQGLHGARFLFRRPAAELFHETYTQLGEPRNWGGHFTYKF